ncbi:MAG TPA: hypothetical protein VLL06_05700 [Nitrospiraceae bacterium]|nr:hypothetical protein [Nitrospiraceae bacterium]
MATHTLEAMLSHCTAVSLRERQVGNREFDQTSSRLPVGAIPLSRRCEERMEYRGICSYEMLEVINEDSLIIEQGEAIAVNRSTEGMLLFMGIAPHVKQLIEVHTSRFGWGRTANVFEARWVSQVRVESLGDLYLVGCRRIFGPCHYLSF